MLKRTLDLLKRLIPGSNEGVQLQRSDAFNPDACPHCKQWRDERDYLRAKVDSLLQFVAPLPDLKEHMPTPLADTIPRRAQEIGREAGEEMIIIGEA